MSDEAPYYCCFEGCKGYPYRASDRPHPCGPGTYYATVRDYVLDQRGLAHVTVDSDRDLLRRLVENIGTDRPPRARWAHVVQQLGHGSGVSIAICKALGLDPDEEVGTLTVETCTECGEEPDLCECDDLPNEETPPEGA